MPDIDLGGKSLEENKLTNLLNEKYKLKKTLAERKPLKGTLETELQNIRDQHVQQELDQIESKLKPLYLSRQIAEKCQEEFAKQPYLDVPRVFNNILDTSTYFPDPNDFKGKSEKGSFAELQEYEQWLIGKIHPLLFDKNGEFLAPYQAIFKDSRFDRYKDQPGNLKIDMIKAILVCTVPPSNGTTASTAITQSMQNLLFNQRNTFNHTGAFTLNGLEKYLAKFFKDLATQKLFHKLQKKQSGMTGNNQTTLAQPEMPKDRSKVVSNNFFVSVFNYLSQFVHAVNVAFKMAISYFQSSDLDHYHPEQGYKDAPPSSPSKSRSCCTIFSMFSSEANQKARELDSAVAKSQEYWGTPNNS